MTSRSPCPIACTLDLIDDRWTLLVIRDLTETGKSLKPVLKIMAMWGQKHLEGTQVPTKFR